MPLAIDLFTGLHGWADGLLAEGWRVIGFDLEDMCGQFGVARSADIKLVIQDVLTLHGRQFKDAALIVASPPCQAYSYRAMPWTRAKALPPPDNSLFEACFRIQREAIEAAGRFIPLVVENVCGAQKWVGRARWHYGSFYLWGDVPALMPITRHRQMKSDIVSVRHQGCTNFHQSQERRATKNDGGSWFAVAHNTTSGHGQNPDGRKMSTGTATQTSKGRSAALGNYDALRNSFQLADGIKGFTPHGQPLGKNELGRKHGSRSKARKAASAHIAKIPYELSRWIGRAWAPSAGVKSARVKAISTVAIHDEHT